MQSKIWPQFLSHPVGAGTERQRQTERQTGRHSSLSYQSLLDSNLLRYAALIALHATVVQKADKKYALF